MAWPRNIFEKLRIWLRKRLRYLVIFNVLGVILLILLWKRVVIFVNAGEIGVLYRPFSGGTVTDYVYGEGIHFLHPINRMAIYNSRVQIIRHEFAVLTNKGLSVTLKIAVRFRPILDLLGVLHQSVGPNYPNKIILPQIESVLRKGLGRHSPEDIYTNKDQLLNKLITLAIDEVGRRFIIVDDIIISTVVLPPTIKTAIQNKLVEEQKALAYVFRLQREVQEAERKRIEAQGIHDYNELIAQNLDEKLIRWQGIRATLELAQSENSKIVVIGSGKDGLPIILGNY